MDRNNKRIDWWWRVIGKFGGAFKEKWKIDIQKQIYWFKECMDKA